MIPTRKVSAGVVAGVVTTIVVWALNKYLAAEIPPEVAGAIQTGLSFLASWAIPDKYEDQ